MKPNQEQIEKALATMLADLWERDIAEIRSTRPTGGQALCRKLEKSVQELREFSKAHSNS